MFLILRDNRIFRSLTIEEQTAIFESYNHKAQVGQGENLADKVLLEMRNKKLWLACDCKEKPFPLLSSVYRNDTERLFLRNFGTAHAESCPLRWDKKEEDDQTSNGARKSAGAKKAEYKSILPLDQKATPKVKQPSNSDQNDDKLRRQKLPSLARLLLSILEDSGLDRLSLPLPKQKPKLKTHLNQVERVLDNNEFMDKRKLSEIILLKPWLTESELENTMQRIENATWPANRERTFWIIFTSDKVTENESCYTSVFGKHYFYRPTRRFAINGEKGVGLRPPYWVIVRFVRDQLTKKVVCRDGYAHAMHSTSYPVPVDSNLERETLNDINYAVEWITDSAEYPKQNFSLHKPLFDIEVNDGEDGKGYVIPDFIIDINSPGQPKRSVVIETMGYTSEEYSERKKVQHMAMKQLGEVVMDPPNWPYEPKQEFKKRLYRFLVPVEYRKGKNT
ncbi:hypothetical protein ABRP83_13405 [Pectobacterium brasiliense]|uniref:hypothetical protein n=1 Tax=Pectobacterium brasiliense TaxID=180957 RepID=UPI0032EA93BC